MDEHRGGLLQEENPGDLLIRMDQVGPPFSEGEADSGLEPGVQPRRKASNPASR